MMEIAAASGRALADSLAGPASGAGRDVGLRDATIPAPLVLTGGVGHTPALECRVDLRSAAIEIQSVAAKGQGALPCALLHMIAVFVRMT